MDFDQNEMNKALETTEKTLSDLKKLYKEAEMLLKRKRLLSLPFKNIKKKSFSLKTKTKISSISRKAEDVMYNYARKLKDASLYRSFPSNIPENSSSLYRKILGDKYQAWLLENSIKKLLKRLKSAIDQVEDDYRKLKLLDKSKYKKFTDKSRFKEVRDLRKD